jgi:hypothetical protein
MRVRIRQLSFVLLIAGCVAGIMAFAAYNVPVPQAVEQMHRSRQNEGIEVDSVKRGARNSAKYVYWSELQAAYGRGHSVLVYQHFRRVKRELFVASQTACLAEKLASTHVAAFKTAHVVFLLAVQPRHVDVLGPAIEQVRLDWPDQIKVGVASW